MTLSKQRIRLYLIFIIIFFIFHAIGAVSANLPYILNSLLTFSVVLTALLICDKWFSGVSFSQVLFKLGFHKTKMKKLNPGILISIFLILLYPLFYFLSGVKIFLNDSWFLNLSGLFLTGGLAEELFFRGFLFRHLRESMNFKNAAVTSMIIFAASHLLLFTYFDWSIALFSTILAVVISTPLSYLFEKADNTVWSPAFVHTTVRTIGLVVTTPESDFIQLTLFWMTGCIIIPLVVVISIRDFREMWNDKLYSS